jgi:tetratricopeptide (TPR) repeat protein
MNVTEYIQLINKPDAIHEKQTEALEKIVQEFPYFQSARALYLKGLYNQNSFKYNYALKITAAHTTDRSILFDFISSDTFTTIQKELFYQKLAEISNINVNESELVSDNVKLEIIENTVEQSILTSIKEATLPVVELEVPKITIDDFVEITEEVKTVKTSNEETTTEVAPNKNEFLEEKLELGKPLTFSLNERHSFQEWLQLSKLKPIERDEQQEQTYISETDPTSEPNFEKQKKNILIDKFIENNPKIPPIKKDTEVPAIFYEPSHADNSSLMTETLARVYIEQKKYQKAMQAYEILILKYPEKSSFFADRILDIKHLQQNNK